VEFLFVIGLIIIIALVMPKPGETGGASIGFADKLIIEKKQCPPHQWFWQEITDQNGEKQGERIVCKVCGPIGSMSGSEE
jgi:hypothetical protein